MMTLDKYVKFIISAAECQTLAGVWDGADICWSPNIEKVYESRRCVFLWIFMYAIKSGHLKVAKKSNFLEGSAEELAALFDRTMPKTVQELIPYSYKDSPDPAIRDNPPDLSKMSEREIIQQIDLAMYLWFFNDDCPGGAVWVLDDGSLCWT